MKSTVALTGDMTNKVAPVRERGLKCNYSVPRLKNLKVAPVRERGLKSNICSTPRAKKHVAPVRERGLK